MKRTNISLPDEMYKRIKDEGIRNKGSVSSIIRRAYRVYRMAMEGWLPANLEVIEKDSNGVYYEVDSYYSPRQEGKMKFHRRELKTELRRG